MKKIILMSLLGLVAMSSCKKEKVIIKDDTNSKYEIIHKDTTSNNWVVTLYSEADKIYNEYTNFYMSVKDFDGKEIKDAEIKFSPIMDMGTMSHACPLIQPKYESDNGMYHGVAIFTMAGVWDFKMIVNEENIQFPLNIESLPTGLKYVNSYSGTDGSKYVISFIQPIKWKQGMNDFSIMIHKKESNMNFPPVDDFTVVLDPQMTSMGHGSPNNISPENTGNGIYKGKVNFTMTGDWRLNFDLIRGNDTIAKTYLEIDFK